MNVSYMISLQAKDLVVNSLLKFPSGYIYTHTSTYIYICIYIYMYVCIYRTLGMQCA